MTAQCLRCGRPTPDGYVCVTETGRAAAQLAEMLDMLPAARDVAYRLSANLSGSGGAGKPGSRLPLDLAATAKCDSVTNVLTTWTRHVAEERGLRTPQAGSYSVYAMSDDPLEFAAVWLTEHLEWMRHRPEVDEFLADVDAAVRVMRGLVRGPSEQRYLGPCGALVVENYERTETEGWIDESGIMRTCDGDVYGRAGGDKGTCRTCGAQVEQNERRAWLDEVRRDWLFTARDIAEAYEINVKTIRSWHNRGHLAAHGHDPEGAPLHKIGEVLDLAAGDAARREEARAARARRKEAAA
jgi:hypothetical protein